MKPTNIQLSHRDLDGNGGVFCPNPKAGMALWDSHPKVFLNLAQTGSAKCPYCGTEFELAAGELQHGRH